MWLQHPLDNVFEWDDLQPTYDRRRAILPTRTNYFSPLPSQFAYFPSNEALGGYGLADYCIDGITFPTTTSFSSWNDLAATMNCADIAQQDVQSNSSTGNLYGSTYGPDAFLLDTTANIPRYSGGSPPLSWEGRRGEGSVRYSCHRTRCTSSGDVEIMVRTTTWIPTRVRRIVGFGSPATPAAPSPSQILIRGDVTSTRGPWHHQMPVRSTARVRSFLPGRVR